MRLACWVPKATHTTHTHTQYVIFIAFLREKLLRERSSLSCTYFACVVHRESGSATLKVKVEIQGLILQQYRVIEKDGRDLKQL